MKRIECSKKWLWLPVAGAFCATGWLCVRSVDFPALHAKRSDDKADDIAVSSKTPNSSPPLVKSKAPHASRGVDALPERPTPSDRIHPITQSALDNHPELSQYHWLSRKVLPTADQRRMLEEMLSDPEMIQNARHDLLASNETTYSREEEAKRMVQIEFLNDAVGWPENPEMAAVAEAIEDILLAENISAELPDDLAQSLAGDKMDLYTQVIHSSPEHAKVIAEHASGKPVEPLLSYSKEWYEREMVAMQADERP